MSDVRAENAELRSEPSGGSPKDSPTDILVTALVGVITGVGALGFVTLVGGAILYAQTAALGLPADQAVAAMPQSTLLVVGARLLVPLLAALGALVLLVGLAEALIPAGRDSTDDRREPDDATHHDDDGHERAAAEQTQRKKPLVRERALRWLRRWARRLSCLIAAIAGLTFLLVDVIIRAHGPAWLGVLGVLLGAGLTTVVWVLADRKGFATFVIGLVVAASAYMAFIATALAALVPEVRAVAIARNDGTTIAGLLATANATEVVVGEVCQHGRAGYRGLKRSGILIVIPRTDVPTLLLTTNGTLDDAINRESVLLDHLPDLKRSPSREPAWVCETA
jgi:hypothetical protein